MADLAGTNSKVSQQWDDGYDNQQREGISGPHRQTLSPTAARWATEDLESAYSQAQLQLHAEPQEDHQRPQCQSNKEQLKQQR